MSARWSPDDDALDALARSMRPADLAGDRVEHNRTAVLAQVHRPEVCLPTFTVSGFLAGSFSGWRCVTRALVG